MIIMMTGCIQLLRFRRCSAHGALAFTLVELTVVMVIMAIIAGTVTLSLAGVQSRARMEDVVDAWTHHDQRLRQLAMRFGQPLVVRWQLDQSNVRVSRHHDSDLQVADFTLPGEYRIEEVRLANVTVTDGEVTVPYSTMGYTPVYAVWLVGPKGESRWLVASVTGSMTLVSHEQEVAHIFAAIGEARHHAD